MAGKKHQPFGQAAPPKKGAVQKEKTVGKTSHVGESFACAVEGFKTVLMTERNIQIHLLISVMVCLAGVYFQLSVLEWVAVVLAIGGMLSLEIMNTAVEYLVDLTQGNTYHPVAKKAKDVAAAGCMVFAVCSSVLGFVVFLPKILKLIS